ncbi:MAG TPA: radical SAM protein [Nitrososphaeraceae archaeon]|nr:radical SAM protein [Nitrososphaeraceae archaeon]
MTIELRPLGVKCNLRCGYCYQNPQRDAGNVVNSYDMNKMKLAIEREGGPFSLFGGEPLLIPEDDLEELWSWGFRKWGRNSVQTNGTLINDHHIQLFKKYNVRVGISIDGPGELNDLRWMGTLENTRAATNKTEKIIERLCKEGIPPSLIITLHRRNATQDKIPIMHEWIKYLENIGIRHVRLHIMEAENEFHRKMYSLTIKENIEAFLSFAILQKQLKSLKFDIFEDMYNMLLGNDDQASCIWNACDPYTTRAVQGIEGNGQRSNCGRINKDGIDYVKSNREGFERYLALYSTPQEYGGCKDCRFFLMCKGQCPGTAIDGDWRNRTEYCEVWKTLYENIEEEMIKDHLNPVSTNSNLRYVLEKEFISSWINNHDNSMSNIINLIRAKQAID